jgi:uncharacterized protein
MLLVPTYVAPSKIHGLGLFAKAFIAKGTLVWKFDDQIDRLISIGMIERAAPTARAFLLHYSAHIKPDLYLFCGDDARFVNHSSPGNIKCMDNSIDCDDNALRDIEPGEEIVEDYRNFCLDQIPG